MHDTFAFAASQVARSLGDTVDYYVFGIVREIPAVFGDGFRDVQSGEARVSSRRPEVTIAKEDLLDEFGDPYKPETGDHLEIRENHFEVVTVRPDIEDVSWTLTLKKV